MDKMFEKISVKEIKKKIKEFEQNSNSYKSSELQEKIKNVLLFNVDGFGFSTFTSFLREYQITSQLFRIRKFEQDTISVHDLWEPPSDKVDYGRFNKPKEQFLYITIGDYLIPKKEVGILDGDNYILIYYKIVETLSLLELGFKYKNINNYNKLTNKKISLLDKFIRKYISNEKEGAYKISSILSNDIADYQEIDGWCYPSIHNTNITNACIKKSATSKLEIESIFLCKSNIDKDEYLYSMIIDDNSNIQVFNDWNKKNSKAYEILNQVHIDNKEVQKIKTVDKKDALLLLNVVD